MRLNLKGSTATVGALLLLAGMPAAAQDTATEPGADASSAEAGAIVVTATRSGTALENLPVSVSVVNEEDLREQLRQNRNILSALELTVPGLSIQPHGAACRCSDKLCRSRQSGIAAAGRASASWDAWLGYRKRGPSAAGRAAAVEGVGA